MIYIDLNMSLEVETRDLARSPFRIGDWLIEPSLNRISRGEETIQFELKWMDALVCLAERAGEVVSRIEIIDRVWATEFITDNTLTHTIAEIRNALGDDAKKPTFVETIRRRGYRLIAPVKPVLSEQDAESKVTKFPVPLGPFPVDDERSPYPGLAAFTEADAEFFFGREAEVAKMWRKLTSRRLLAVIGPSGVGKSSFLRAGVIPAKPEGWGVLVCQPGEAPLSALATALLPEFVDDLDAGAHLVGPHEADRLVTLVARWRERHDQALLVVDQFEELFTQNPLEAQAGFADLLRKLVDNSDVHILLSMRDDFLYRCHGHEPVRPIFEDLTALEQPSSKSLRRALVEPARRLGFAFEDTDLPGEMVAEVESERGALPLLAFAVACLWDTRDREGLVLTRQAYNDIGGVGGALARHAEATIDRIGTDRIAVVRELFRNLVTAEGTRAVREWEELLSVFHGGDPGAGLKPAPTREMAAAEKRTVGAGFTPAREAAEEVLRELIDARLLTSYEVHEEGEEPTRRIEIIHESLLANWPRLVGWQTQDADSTRLRDELRQAARTWDEHDRSDELLWTGSVYREFTVWRERYPGGLSELEEAFAAAMTSLAKRRKRRRRMAAATALVLAVVLASVFGILWRRSVLETRRAEAAKLLALAGLQLENDPTEALAYAVTSLALRDTWETRVFVMNALWAAPPARVLISDLSTVRKPIFSPDGRWLAASGHHEEVMVWPENGGDPIRLPGHIVSPLGPNIVQWSSSEYVVTGNQAADMERVRVWSIPDGRLVRTIEFEGPGWRWQVSATRLFAQATETDNSQKIVRFRGWELPGGQVQDLGSVDLTLLDVTNSYFDPTGQGWIYARGDSIYYRPLPIRDGAGEILLGRHENSAAALSPTHDEQGFIWSRDRTTSEMKRWSLANKGAEPLAVIPPTPGEGRYLVRDRTGQWRNAGRFETGEGTPPNVWYLDFPEGARTLELRRNGSWFGSWQMAIHPAGTWMATPSGEWDKLVFWPLVKTYPIVLDVKLKPFAFSPDGAWIVVPWGEGFLRMLRLQSTGANDLRHLVTPSVSREIPGLVFDPSGERLVTPGFGTDLSVVPLDGTEARPLAGFSENHFIFGAAFSPSGRLVAAATAYGSAERKAMRVWDLETGDVKTFELEPPHRSDGETPSHPTGYEHNVSTLAFETESILYGGGSDGVRRWDLTTGEVEVIPPGEPGGYGCIFMSTDRRKMLTVTCSADLNWAKNTAVVHDFETGTAKAVDLNVACEASTLAVEPVQDVVVEGCRDGTVRVGRIDAGESHLFLGHEGPVVRVAISPDLEWIASAGEDNTLRLWPMPDLSKPPLHTLPHDELLAKLKTLTNLRVVRDEESTSGWKLEVGPFPGWETVPSW